VPPRVPDQLISISEGLLTEFARVPLVVRLMDPQVLSEVFPLNECFVAHFAGVWSRSIRVTLVSALLPRAPRGRCRPPRGDHHLLRLLDDHAARRRRKRHRVLLLCLDGGRCLAQQVLLSDDGAARGGGGNNSCRAALLFHNLNRDPVSVRVLFPHSVRIVDKDVRRG
jgi:hypothetical protein